MTYDKIVLGIDPGTLVMGYGVVGKKGASLQVLDLGVLRISSKHDHTLRLKMIFERVLSLIEEHHPDELAIESPFFGKNVQSMLKLGRAQGVSMAAGLVREVPIFEYSPKRIKQSVTGNGNATKQQVAAMLHKLFPGKASSDYLDATDALAAAVCHHIETKSAQLLNKAIAGIQQPKKAGRKKTTASGGKRKAEKEGWAGFIQSHPDRLHTK
ncbi:MAG: crossover junction endodeoxyribonuclease RuvC [Flavobacteriales bacterium]